MARHWIAGAVKNPGALHKDLGVPQGQSIPSPRLASALRGSYGPAVKKKAQLAKTLKAMH